MDLTDFIRSSYEYLIAEFGFDRIENGPLKVMFSVAWVALFRYTILLIGFRTCPFCCFVERWIVQSSAMSARVRSLFVYAIRFLEEEVEIRKSAS